MEACYSNPSKIWSKGKEHKSARRFGVMKPDFVPLDLLRLHTESALGQQELSPHELSKYDPLDSENRPHRRLQRRPAMALMSRPSNIVLPVPTSQHPYRIREGNSGQRAAALRVTALGCSAVAATEPLTDTRPVSLRSQHVSSVAIMASSSAAPSASQNLKHVIRCVVGHAATDTNGHDAVEPVV